MNVKLTKTLALCLGALSLILFAWKGSSSLKAQVETNSASSKKNSQYYPKQLLIMDEHFSHHVILVEKSTHRLLVYQNQQTQPKLVSEFQIATGKKMGNKLAEGDEKTPEGVYQLREFFNAEQLRKTYGDYGKTYGAGAFVLNYPNKVDRQVTKKTGSGIWLHSTNDESRISKGLDSRGCVVVANNDLKNISNIIDLDNKTYIVIAEHLDFIEEKTWNKERQKVMQTINQWLEAWNNTDLNTYAQFYHPNFFDDSGKNKAQWVTHKKNVFSNTKNIKILQSSLSALWHGDFLFVSFQQDYYSSAVKDTGRKHLILTPDSDYSWKILYEGWEDIPGSGAVAFQPAQRF